MSRKIKNSKNFGSATKKGGGKSIDRPLPSKFEITFDEINIKILKEIIKNSNVTSSDISASIDVPLSTVQRRRRQLEDSTILEKRSKLISRK